MWNPNTPVSEVPNCVARNLLVFSRNCILLFVKTSQIPRNLVCREKQMLINIHEHGFLKLYVLFEITDFCETRYSLI